ncbi:MAG: hypothetical protein CMF49_09345 [Legionellales bacterium]|nr:hypothetical protein [Legionellales bacterium]|tara:strand:- start:492 stop:695 length:204 start_codon:yes stop_codon:yes gene_type:complete
MSNDYDAKQANTKKSYEVTSNNLPLSCPMPDMRLWDAHPKVYLPIEKTGRAVCPYCEATFILVDKVS